MVSLVAIAMQSIVNSSLEIRLENLGATQLPNFLRRLAYSQVACASLAMLDFAACCETESLFRGLVSL